MMRARDNPFRTDRVLSVRYRFIDGTDWPALLKRLETMDYRGAIVGSEGSGKTTLHEDLADQLASRGLTIRWLRFNRENRHAAAQRIDTLLTRSRPDEFLCVDGAEQLGIRHWQRLKKRSTSMAGLIINTHAPGRLPTLIDCHTTPAILQYVIEQLTPPDDRPSPADLGELFAMHHGNLRLCLRGLYDQWSERSTSCS